MTEQELNEKLNKVVSIAQEKILTLLNDLHNEQAVVKAQTVFSSCPIVLETIDVQKNEFGKTTQVGGYATPDRIAISQNDIQKINLNTPQELENLLGTIIHEYVHQFRRVDSQYGNLFEEASASIFAEMCVNYSKVKNNEQNNTLFNMVQSVDYQKAESQVRGILYVLKQKNMDISMMTEYILGDENRFKQICSQMFGSSFDNYFNQANNTPTHQQYTNISEEMITQILTDYVKNNQLSYRNYWKNNNVASSTNLYFSGSPVLVQSVANAGISAIRDDEQDLYKAFEYTAKVNQEQSQFIDDEKRTRIKDKLNQSINLSGKSEDEIYDSLVDICSTYIQNKSNDSEESIIYVEELKKIIPNIEEFADTFKQLRVSRLDSSILENMDLSNISFGQIYDKMSLLMPKSQTSKVEKNFIATKDPNEVARIHSNPQYASWRFEYVDGEYRFYSPNYQNQNQKAGNSEDNKIQQSQDYRILDDGTIEWTKPRVVEQPQQEVQQEQIQKPSGNSKKGMTPEQIKQRLIDNFINHTVWVYSSEIMKSYPYDLSQADISKDKDGLRGSLMIPGYPVSDEEYDTIINTINEKLKEFTSRLILEDEKKRLDLMSMTSANENTNSGFYLDGFEEQSNSMGGKSR